jgi:polar amino acid transport system substrate-binding protein
MRFLRATCVVLCVALGLAACSGDDDDTVASTKPKGPLVTITPGVLTVGTELPAPTFWEGADYRSVHSGLEYDLARAIAKRLGGLRVEVVKFPFVGISAGADCTCDLDFSQIGITPERRTHWDFTVPYFDADYAVMVKTSSTVADLEAARRLQFGVQAETTTLDFLREKVRPVAEPKLYDTTKAMFDAFNTDEVQAILFDLPILLSAMKEGQVADAKIVGQFATGDRYGGILPKGSPNTDAINTTMRTMIADGTIERLQEQYFGVTTKNAAPFWLPTRG